MKTMSRVLVVNGPNLNLLGTRRPEIYGSTTLPELEDACRAWGAALNITVDTFQSNHEGSIIDRLHQAREAVDGIIINPGAFTHYSYAIYDALEAVELPTVEIHISDITRRETWRQQSVIAPACVATIYGRGTDGYDDALRHLVYRAARPPITIAYGSHSDQVGDLRIPDNPGPYPIAVLIHGGFWRPPWQRDLMDGLAADLAGRGIATWNVEYRRGPGGWEEALFDIASALDHLAGLATDYALDLSRLVVAGHSAGGHLALWGSGRSRLAHDSPWGSPVVTPLLAVALAGVIDLERAGRDDLGDSAVEEFFGTTIEADASPSRILPLKVPQLIVHGTADDRVPVDHSRTYVERARAAGDSVRFVELDGADHSVLIDELSAEWDEIATLICDHLTKP
jgi:3-dehydroquinate dehydratase type II